MLLAQLAQDAADPDQVLGRLAAHHAGWAAGVRPFRTGFVVAGEQTFPAPKVVETLMALLLVRSSALFRQSKSVTDDLHAAAFLIWGLLAVHPYDDANGRVALDFVQQILMRRWGSKTPVLGGGRIDRELQPIFAVLDLHNDGTPVGHLTQLCGLLSIFDKATLESVKANFHFVTVAKVLAVSLKPREAKPCQ